MDIGDITKLYRRLKGTQKQQKLWWDGNTWAECKGCLLSAEAERQFRLFLSTDASLGVGPADPLELQSMPKSASKLTWQSG